LCNVQYRRVSVVRPGAPCDACRPRQGVTCRVFSHPHFTQVGGPQADELGPDAERDREMITFGEKQNSLQVCPTSRQLQPTAGKHWMCATCWNTQGQERVLDSHPTAHTPRPRGTLKGGRKMLKCWAQGSGGRGRSEKRLNRLLPLLLLSRCWRWCRCRCT
jgi:hypothetical protein